MSASEVAKKIQVDDSRVGVWIAGSSVNSPIHFSIAIVDLAVEHGFEINEEQWKEDQPLFTTGEPTFDMIEDLGTLTDIALDYLNDNVTDGYYFDFNDGLCLFKEQVD
jgi:hypothetical protein